jgi:hypothetical protein
MALVDTRVVSAAAIPSVVILSAFIVGLPVAALMCRGIGKACRDGSSRNVHFLLLFFPYKD